jgi:predicted AlkP superfamily phosphohydrolase/phosphomutase
MKRAVPRIMPRFNNKRNPILYIVLILIISLFIFTFKENGKMDERRHKKILLIGIDGTDPKVISKLMEEGKLPNFSRLKENGTFTPLETSISPQSPIAWATIATGSNPGKHSIFDFIKRNPDNYLPELSLTKTKSGIMSTKYESNIKGEPFWKITSEAGIPSTLVRWPMTFPAEEVDGKLLAGLGVPDIKGLLNSYSFYTSEKQSINGEGIEKVIKVEIEGRTIDTVIKGPRTKKGGKIVDVTVPMQIKPSADKESVTLIIQGSKYTIDLNGWSDWVKIEFKVNFFTKVTGICRFYLERVDPINMYMTTVQIDPKNPVQPISYPDGYSQELAGEIGMYHTLGLPEDTNALNEGKIGDDVFMEQVWQINEEREKMFWYEFNRFEAGVFAFVFDGSDRVEHMFWDENVFAEDGELTINPNIEEYYIRIDRFLGDVLKKTDDEIALFVFSDHGFSGFERSVSINTWLVENRYMTLTEQPTEKNAGELFKFVDWNKTKAYSVGFTGIYINLKGREGKGIVDPSEKEALIGEIVQKLKQLEDKELGRSAMINVYKSSEVYSGPYVEEAPDIIVGFAPGYRMGWQNAIGGVTPNVFFDNTKHWRGDHLIDPSAVPGVLFTNLKIDKTNPHQMDIAPTILYLLGLDIPDDMDGEPLLNETKI